MAVNYPLYPCVATNDLSPERFDARNAISNANPSPEGAKVNSPIGSGRDAGWRNTDVFFDPVDFLPMDPFGMNVASLIGNIGDCWMDCFDPDATLPLDPFGMSMETVIASLIEDFKATYGCHGSDANRAERISDCTDVLCSSLNDLFEMESTLSAAIAGWVEDFHAMSMDDDQCYMAFDHWLDDTFFEDSIETDCVLPSDPFEMEIEYFSMAKTSLVRDVTGDLQNVLDAESDVNFTFSDYDIEDATTDPMMDIEPFFNSNVSEVVCSNEADGECFLHEGLFFALGYLDVQDLLSMEMVCKSLHSAVADDSLLWKCIQINSTLSEKITDDALLRLTQRAQGSLHSLSLVGCTKISDDGLKCVLEDNPTLVKLCVPQCVTLSTGGMINNLKAFKGRATPGIKHLKLGRMFSVSNEQFEELKLLLGIDKGQQPLAKPRFYHIARRFLECDDDRTLDIEMCLACKHYAIVYDCTLESCKEKGAETCRACATCMKRCAQCGRCIRDGKYIELFTLEYLGSCCWSNPTIC